MLAVNSSINIFIYVAKVKKRSISHLLWDKCWLFSDPLFLVWRISSTIFWAHLHETWSTNFNYKHTKHCIAPSFINFCIFLEEIQIPKALINDFDAWLFCDRHYWSLGPPLHFQWVDIYHQTIFLGRNRYRKKGGIFPLERGSPLMFFRSAIAENSGQIFIIF